MAQMEFTGPPPEIPGSKTYVYKTVGHTKIQIDVWLPSQVRHANDSSIPVLLYIHGGAWISGNRAEYSRPLLHEFQAAGFVVASMDYRLLPESDFIHGQLEDIRDVEVWIRNDLLTHIPGTNPRARIGHVVVAGSSAGAHLALLTPSLWEKPPVTIISLYGPTDMHNIPPVSDGLTAQIQLPTLASESLRAATTYLDPPTNTPLPRSFREFLSPRAMIGFYLFRHGTMVDFLLKGLRPLDVSGTSEAKLALPEAGSASKEEIDAISPIHIAQKLRYPPTCQIMGSEDGLFDLSHVTNFSELLERQGIPHKDMIVPNASHAFDVAAEIDGQIHVEIIRPAVRWALGFVPDEREGDGIGASD